MAALGSLARFIGSAKSDLVPVGPAIALVPLEYPLPLFVPLLNNSGVVAGTYGDATNVAQVTIATDGRVTSAVDVPIAFPFQGGTIAQRIIADPTPTYNAGDAIDFEDVVLDTMGGDVTYNGPGSGQWAINVSGIYKLEVSVYASNDIGGQSNHWNWLDVGAGVQFFQAVLNKYVTEPAPDHGNTLAFTCVASLSAGTTIQLSIDSAQFHPVPQSEIVLFGAYTGPSSGCHLIITRLA